MRATSPDGVPIVGTLETIQATAVVKEDSYSRNEKGEILYEWFGESEIHWDTQTTQERDGKIVFIDEDGEEWTEDQLVLVDDDAS